MNGGPARQALQAASTCDQSPLLLVRRSRLVMRAGIAWHPDPAQTPASVQLVTASADKTARLFSGEGKQLGTLQVSSHLCLPLCLATFLTFMLGNAFGKAHAAKNGGVVSYSCCCHTLFVIIPCS